MDRPISAMKSIYVVPTLIAFLFAALSPLTANADIYKYVDDSGVIHFSNIPESESEKVVREKQPYVEKAYVKKTAADSRPAGRPVVENAVYKPSSDPVRGVPYAEIINAKCDKYGVDPTLVKSIIKAESNFNPNAVSPKGARGLMQLMPSTAADMGVGDIFDPEQNIEGGVRYFKYLLENFQGDVELSVAAYNCGQGRVMRNGFSVPEIPETKNYVKKVLKLSRNPITGMSFTRPIYKIEMKDGSILFTDSPVSGGSLSLVD